MKYLMVISRWLVWVLIMALESVIGLPWVSLWLFGDWLALSHGGLEQGVVLVVSSILLATAYQISLPASGLMLGVVWLMAGGFVAKLGQRRLNLKFWSVILTGAVVWWLKKEELQGSWVWWSGVLSWLVIVLMNGQRILWKKPKTLFK